MAQLMCAIAEGREPEISGKDNHGAGRSLLFVLQGAPGYRPGRDISQLSHSFSNLTKAV
jgi:hypothetical protein